MRVIRGKKALVTGAGSGIGRAISLALAKQGVDLLLVDINEPGLAETATEVRQTGVNVVERTCDVGSEAQVAATVATVIERWGGVDILVNNAGITYYGKTADMSAEHWEQVLRVNLLSHIQFTRELLPSLLARREAHVVNICSMFGLVGVPKLAAYCTTKFGLVGLSEIASCGIWSRWTGSHRDVPGIRDHKVVHVGTAGRKIEGTQSAAADSVHDAEKVAKATVKAIKRDRRRVIIAPAAWILTGAKRYFPGVMDFLFYSGRRRRIERKMAALKAKQGTQDKKAA